MTNEQAKQEAIRFLLKAGYELFEENHYVKNSTSINLEERAIANDKGEQILFKSYTELFSILKEDNNGWIRIEPDGSNLPVDDRILNSSFIVFDIMDREEEDMSCLTKASANGVIQLFKQRRITHYKPIKPELKPIY